jgi:hypothetical protein
MYPMATAEQEPPLWPAAVALPVPAVWLFAAIFLGLPGSAYGPLAVPPVAGLVALWFERTRPLGTALIFGWLLSFLLLIVGAAVASI